LADGEQIAQYVGRYEGRHLHTLESSIRSERTSLFWEILCGNL
jgi:hypothetical protein